MGYQLARHSCGTTPIGRDIQRSRQASYGRLPASRGPNERRAMTTASLSTSPPRRVTGRRPPRHPGLEKNPAAIVRKVCSVQLSGALQVPGPEGHRASQLLTAPTLTRQRSVGGLAYFGRRAAPEPALAPTRGDLTPQPAVGQLLPAGLVVVAGVQVHRGRIGQQPPAGPCTAVRVAAAVSRVTGSRPSSRRLAGAGTAASGMPAGSQTTERLRPCLRRSTRLGPRRSTRRGGGAA